MTRLLVCGGRAFSDARLLTDTLNLIHAETPITCVIHGANPGTPTAMGADAMADLWATSRGIAVERFAADWKTYGRAAGPMRNEKMLRLARPDRWVAMPGGAGTADMVRRCREAGVVGEECGVDVTR